MRKIIVNVHLKKEVLDPQGRAILAALHRLELNEVTQVRQGKQFILEFNDEFEVLITEKIEQIANNLLSNPVIEDYSIEVLDES